MQNPLPICALGAASTFLLSPTCEIRIVCLVQDKGALFSDGFSLFIFDGSKSDILSGKIGEDVVQ